MQEYFEEIDAILKNTDHKLVAVGRRALEIDVEDLDSNITTYPSVIELLEDI